MEGGFSSPDQLNYLDLLPKRGKKLPTPVAAVAEHQGVALLYLIDDPDGALSASEREKAQKLLANRSDPAWLGIVRPGSLEIFPIGFPSVTSSLGRIQVIRSSANEAPLFFQSLAQGTFQGNARAESSDYVFRKIFNLLNKTSEAFVPRRTLRPLDVLSMAGRALFFRFLIDRGIVLPRELGEICETARDLKDVFSSAERAARTSVWLDETFNGDFLTLIPEEISVEDHGKRLAAYRAFYRDANERTNGQIFLHLTAILKGWEVVGNAMQGELDWGDLDFAHIPVGVLSQVYESFCHLDDSDEAKRDSVHYTPRIIAELMVDQAFSANASPAEAHVLDPSCGAGIFLVLAFRRLFHERWVRDRERPNYRVILEILYEHLSGFEIREPALRLAALSLYITAIELNARPRPPKSLKFPGDLRGRVLHHFGDRDGEETVQSRLGSLRDDVAASFAGQFDIVLGNPPWTRLREPEAQSSEAATEKRRQSKTKPLSEQMNSEFTRIGKEVLSARGLQELSEQFENPDKNPDLPFVWRATQWAKEDGTIALALPARIFHRSTARHAPGPGQCKRASSWESLAGSLAVTGLISGADLRWSSVWNVKYPWCLLFARNRVPESNHRFRFSAPLNDPQANCHARFRIDYEAVSEVSIRETLEQPWLLKTLSLGTRRDAQVMEQILAAFPKTLVDIWSEWDIRGEKTGKGFDLSRDLAKKQDENEDAGFLVDMPVFKRPDHAFSIDAMGFETFEEKHGNEPVHRPRTQQLYGPPLVIVPESPRPDPRAAQAYRASRRLAFSKSSYGYSTAGHPAAKTLGALIYLSAHSTLFRFFCLMTSRRTGFDRQTFNKNEFDALPFPELGSLGSDTKRQIRDLADRLERDAEKPWDELDRFLFALYGLDDSDVQVARDTLFASAYYRKKGKAALSRPMREMRADFASELENLIQPFFKVCGESVSVIEPSFQQDVWREAWFFLSVHKGKAASNALASTQLLEAAMAKANETGASRIVVRAPRKQGLLVGLLSQQRWWTITRARMCGRHIIREHLDAFGITGGGGDD